MVLYIALWYTFNEDCYNNYWVYGTWSEVCGLCLKMMMVSLRESKVLEVKSVVCLDDDGAITYELCGIKLLFCG